ncbi:MAG TPA: hypothetical protein VH088_06850 [Terriglobales bacterium]|nr:hypothetical protein [Terriglobales bacterium]
MTPAIPPAYDLAVAYRVYPKVSKPALSLPFGDDKPLLAETCLKSFNESISGLRVKLWAILDGCPPEYEEFFRKHIAADDLVVLNLDGAGNGATFARQIDILLKQSDAEHVYFAEDDYLYLPGKFRAMLSFLRSQPDVDFISPFDHLDCYTLSLHHSPKWLRVHDSQHWRTASSTCLTFLTRKETLRKYEAVFRSYSRGNFDSSLWMSLTKQRVFNPLAMITYFVQRKFYWKILAKSWFYNWAQILFGKKAKLWVPVPGIATHLDSDSLSPSVDWLSQMQREIDAKSPNSVELHADTSVSS